uniref:Uncharacterized protein n=1 Tax=Prochlorococcus marinus str. P0902-H212 TaxID=1620696 RepID=A0A0D5A2Q1_PROMR|nr:hypothetical protein FA02_0190 [Prochlorococcus marinus str. P0902-H212]
MIHEACKGLTLFPAERVLYFANQANIDIRTNLALLAGIISSPD